MFNPRLLHIRSQATGGAAYMDAATAAASFSDVSPQIIAKAGGNEHLSSSDSRYVQKLSTSLAQLSEQWFDYLAGQLLAETRSLSSSSAVKRHPAFGQLVSLGPVAARKAIERMRAGDVRRQWFPLLKTITQEDPVPVHERGNVPAMTEAWIHWADRFSR